MPRFAVPLLAVLISGSVFAANPTDEVLHLVPERTVVCLVVQDLRGHSARLLDSPFAEWFAKSDFGQAVFAADEVSKVRGAVKAIGAQLGLTATDLRDDILGDAVVFAYQPARAEGEPESGVFLLKARKPDTLAKLIRGVNDEQKKLGELKTLAERKHLDRMYFERDKGTEKEFYRTRDDGVLAFSGQESAIRAVIEREAATTPATPPPFSALLDRLAVRSAAATLVFDPRALDGELTAKTKDSKDPNEQAFLAQFGKLWAATEAVGVSLVLNRDAELALTVAFDNAKLPAELRTLATSAAESTALWEVIPADALFATAGRFDLSHLSAAVQSFLSDDGKKGLKATGDGIAPVVGKDTLPKLLAGIGPDWGLWLTAPGRDSKFALPVATFALRVRPAGSSDDTVGEAIVTGLDFAAQLFRVEYNKTHDDQFTLTSEKTVGGTVKVLKNDKALPPDIQPTYGIRGDFFLLASHPDAGRRFTPPAADAKVANAPLLRVSAKALTEYLKIRRNELSELIGRWTGEKPATLEHQLGELATVLEVFETVELTHSGDGKRMKLAAKVTTAKPLRR